MIPAPPVILHAVIGKYYTVRCARLLAPKDERHPLGDRDGWVPLIGPEHEDRDLINFPPAHIHVDARFVSDTVIQRATRKGRAQGDVLARPLCTYSDGVGGSPRVIEYADRRRLCFREMPAWLVGGPVHFGARLEQAYACTKLKPGLICPHRGIDLRPFVAADGTVECPGHGLKWDTATGDLIRRYPITPAPQPEAPTP